MAILMFLIELIVSVAFFTRGRLLILFMSQI